MAEKTTAQLWEVAKLIRQGVAFQDFPDGVTWDDVAKAEAIAARVNFDSEVEEHTDAR